MTKTSVVCDCCGSELNVYNVYKKNVITMKERYDDGTLKDERRIDLCLSCGEKIIPMISKNGSNE